MRQLHVIPYFDPATEFGGVQTVTRELTRAMVRRGHPVTVLTTDVASRQRRLGSLRETLDGVDIVRVPNLSQALVRLNLYTPFGVRSRLRELVAAHDLVHTHDVFNWLTYRAVQAASAAGVPSLFSTDNLLNFRGLPSRVAARRLLWRALGPRLIAHVDLVHAIREGELDCASMGIPPDKVRYVPNGVALPARRGDGGGFRARHRLGDRTVILFVGQLMHTKGARQLIELAARWRDRDELVFVLVGHRHPEVEVEVDGVTPPNVRLVGFLADEALEDAWAAGDLYVLPTATDVLPNTLLEALARELPVLLSRHAGLPELEAEGAGRFVGLSVDELAAGIDGMLAERARWPEMGRAGRALVEREFTLERVHAGYERLYEELLTTSRPGARRP